MPSHIEYAATADFLADCCIFGELHMGLVALPPPATGAKNPSGAAAVIRRTAGRVTQGVNDTFF